MAGQASSRLVHRPEVSGDSVGRSSHARSPRPVGTRAPGRRGRGRLTGDPRTRRDAAQPNHRCGRRSGSSSIWRDTTNGYGSPGLPLLVRIDRLLGSPLATRSERTTVDIPADPQRRCGDVVSRKGRVTPLQVKNRCPDEQCCERDADEQDEDIRASLQGHSAYNRRSSGKTIDRGCGVPPPIFYIADMRSSFAFIWRRRRGSSS
jgi:hypothetical protein